MTLIKDPPLVIEMPANFSAMANIRTILRSVLPSLEVDHASLFFSAVTEILSNSITASIASGRNMVEVAVVDSPPVVTVRDRGAGFDPAAETPGPHSTGLGQGLRIARSIIPDLTIQSSADGTVVTIPFPSNEPPRND